MQHEAPRLAGMLFLFVVRVWTTLYNLRASRSLAQQVPKVKRMPETSYDFRKIRSNFCKKSTKTHSKTQVLASRASPDSISDGSLGLLAGVRGASGWPLGPLRCNFGNHQKHIVKCTFSPPGRTGGRPREAFELKKTICFDNPCFL